MKTSKKLTVLCLVMVVVMTSALPLWAEEAHKININKASVAELTQLKGIGHQYAERIVQYREELKATPRADRKPSTLPESILVTEAQPSWRVTGQRLIENLLAEVLRAR